MPLSELSCCLSNLSRLCSDLIIDLPVSLFHFSVYPVSLLYHCCWSKVCGSFWDIQEQNCPQKEFCPQKNSKQMKNNNLCLKTCVLLIINYLRNLGGNVKYTKLGDPCPGLLRSLKCNFRELQHFQYYHSKTIPNNSLYKFIETLQPM